jgi:hypothetical protein
MSYLTMGGVYARMNVPTKRRGFFCFVTEKPQTFAQSHSLCANSARFVKTACLVGSGIAKRALFVLGGNMGNISLLAKFGKQLRERDGERCYYCQREMISGDVFHVKDARLAASVDHVIPQSKGGKDLLDNLVLCCRSCNSKKRTNELLYLDCGG